MNNFGFLDAPYTPGRASLMLEKIWSKFKQCVIFMTFRVMILGLNLFTMWNVSHNVNGIL